MHGIRTRLALWTCGATFIGLVAFAIAAYVIVVFDEREEAESGKPDDPAEVAGEAREEMLLALAIAAPIGLGLAFGGAVWASRRAVSSIEHATRLQHSYAAFAADASHELRTPLAAVCNELEVGLRRPRSADEWEQSAKTSLGELRRLSGVVEAMLRFSQADSVELAHDELEITDLIDEVAGNQSAATLHVDAAPASGRVRGDSDLLATALGNLVSNAIRLTPATGSVRISVERVGSQLLIHVDDAGPGLPADRSRLFVPFASETGVGLGLAIARRIAARHGGDVTCRDRAPGARFTLSLPALG